MTKAQSKKATPKESAPDQRNNLNIKQSDYPGKNHAEILARVGLSSIVGSANTARIFAQGTIGALGLNESIEAMVAKTEKVISGNMREVEATLTAQAAALDSIFHELARRAALNMGEHLNATEIYLRHAFKAQSQCRSTLETLAEIKAPRHATFVRQANIANGPQQVNNGVQAGEPPAHAHGNLSNQPNELSGGTHDLLTDTRASQAASRVNTPVATLETIDRA